MNTVRLNVADLLAKVKENREKHITEYKEAEQGYKEACIAKMKENLAKAEAGEDIITNLGVVRPTNHEDDYDRLISMLTWTQDTVVELSVGDFDCYVNDKWHWKQSFVTTNSFYAKKLA
jgi:hypothetical protein